MNRALVTGATGMLGSYLVQGLTRERWEVRALVRSTARSDRPVRMGAESVTGDILDADSVRKAATGCDAVFHAAAAIGAGGDWGRFRAGNVSGTAHLIDAAARAGARLVHVSSTSVFGRSRYFEEPTDESKPLPELPPWDAYGRSKQAAERLVLEAGRQGRVWATIVRPPVMYGRWDRQFLPRIGPVFEWGFFPLVGGGRSVLTLVHAGAVAHGAILAVQADAARGRIYHLTNDFDVTVRDLVALAEEGLGRRIHSPTLPLAAARIGFKTLARGLSVAGRKDLSRHTGGTLDMLTLDNPFTSRRARRELGWSPAIHPSQGIPEAFRWWKSHRTGARQPEGADVETHSLGLPGQAVGKRDFPRREGGA